MRRMRMLALVLGLCVAERAEAQTARVERRGSPEVAATPGEPLTLPFRVTNLSSTAATLPGRAELPPGWRAAGGSALRPLEPGEAELRLLGIGVPAAAAAGRHVVRYRAGGAADSAVVVVAERRGIEVRAVDGGGMTVAGAPYAVRFRVVNRGNVAERLALRAEGDQGLRPSADSSSLLLPPSAEAVVTVRARTVAGAGTLRHQVALHVTGTDTAASAMARTLVSIVPRGGTRVRRPSLPAEVRVRAADSLSAASVAFRTNGAVDAAGRVRVDAEARTADPVGTPFARQDEYRLRVDAPGLRLRLGDQTYALSRLTEPGRYAFGAGAEVQRGWIRLGGLAARDRRGEGRGEMTGGFARLGTERARLGVLYARGDSAEARWTVEGVVQPHPLLRVEAEAAPAERDSALPRSIQLRGSSRVFSYDLLHLRGGSPFHARGRGDQDFAAITVRPYGALSLSASARRGGETRLLTDTTVFFRSYRRAAVSWGSRALLEVRETGGDSVSRGDVRAVFARVGVRLPWGGWLYPGFEAGEAVAVPGASPEPYRILSLQSTLSAGGASLWGQVQLRDGASAYSFGDRELSGAFSAQLPVLPRTLLRVSGQGRRIDRRAVEGALDVALERVLPADHRVSVRALAVAQQVGGWRPRMYLEYGVPVGIPLPRQGEERVVARVFDARTGRGMPDVVVRMGDRVAVTDRRGFVTFTGLADGAHLLRVEPGAGPEMVADRPLPLPVTVGDGGTTRVEVGLEQGARLTGTVERVPAAGTDSAAAPLGGVTVEIIGPAGEHRAVTDAQGRFTIAPLRSGWWRVRIAPSSLPRHHALVEEQHVLLQPGGSGEAWLRVEEKERPIQMIEGGELRLQ